MWAWKARGRELNEVYAAIARVVRTAGLEPTPDDALADLRRLEVVAAEHKALREAALWVVLTWDTQGTQHNTMPALRKALGLPPQRPSGEEAQRRLNARLSVPDLQAGFEAVLEAATDA